MKLSTLRYYGPGRLRRRVIAVTSRLGQAWRLATGRLTKDDAQDLYHTVTGLAGWHPLECIDEEGVMERALDRWQEHPALEGYAGDAAARVANKWSSTGDIGSAAIDWAMDLIEEYAKADGVELQPTEAYAEEEA